jgi:hypothetical protein
MKLCRISVCLLPALAAFVSALALSLLAPGAGSAAAPAARIDPDAGFVSAGTQPQAAPAAVQGAVSPLPAGAAPPLKDAGLTIISTGPVITTGLNTTLLVLNLPGATPMRDAHVTLDFWSNDVLVAHLPFTLTLEPGPTVFPVTWATAAFSPAYDTQAANLLIAQWTDVAGRAVDTAVRALNAFGADPTPSVALSDSVWDIGTITQGVVLNRAFTVANVGAADLAVYLAAPGSAQPYRRLPPGDMATYTITLDTLALPPLPLSRTLTIRTSDPAAVTRTIRISGTITPPSGPTAVFARPDRPWDRHVVVYGDVAENSSVYFSDFTSPDPLVNEPCTVSAAGAASVKGVGRACLDTAGSAFGVVNGLRILVDRIDGPLMRFSVPEVIAGGAAYDVQFGRLYAFGDGGAAYTQPVRIISQTLAVATMDALITNVGVWGSLNMQVTVGDLTIYSQTQVITRPTVINLPDFASAINKYIASQPLSRTSDVPFQVMVDGAADVVLTNFTLVPANNVDVAILPGDIAYGPPVTGYTLTEGALAPITTTVRNTGTTDSGPLVVSFYAAQGSPPVLSSQYIRSALVSNVPAGGSAPAAIEWNTTGVTGAVIVTSVVDPLNRVAETNKANNSAEGFLNLLTRPNVAVVRIVPGDLQPVANEAVATSIVLSNTGQTGARDLTVALYDGDPASTIDTSGVQAPGSIMMDSHIVNVAAGAEVTATLTWTPPRTGARQLLATLSANSTSSVPNGPNRRASLPVFVGFRGPILIDSGGANDSSYTPALGYGFLGADGGVSHACGTLSYQTFRQGVGGPLQYRFDNFQPGRAYHLDLVFYECDGAARQQRVLVNGLPVLASADLSDEQPHSFSLRLDPALYACRDAASSCARGGAAVGEPAARNSITLSIDETRGHAAVVSGVHLYDVDYRAVDAGAPAEQPYSMGMTTAHRDFGYLNGTPLQYGGSPLEVMRVETDTADLRYRFDGLDPARRYALSLTFYHRFELTPTLAVDLGTWYHSPAFTVPYSQPYAVNIAIPRGAYAADGSITVSISRTDIVTGSFVNELALEEQTLGETLSSADLMLLTLDGPQAITAGLPVSYTLLVINNGPDTAGDVVLSAGPAGSNGRMAAVASSGFCDVAAPISCSLGVFPSGASAAVTVVLTPSVAGLLNTPVSIGSDTSDPNSANNSVLLSSQVLPPPNP